MDDWTDPLPMLGAVTARPATAPQHAREPLRARISNTTFLMLAPDAVVLFAVALWAWWWRRTASRTYMFPRIRRRRRTSAYIPDSLTMSVSCFPEWPSHVELMLLILSHPTPTVGRVTTVFSTDVRRPAPCCTATPHPASPTDLHFFCRALAPLALARHASTRPRPPPNPYPTRLQPPSPGTPEKRVSHFHMCLSQIVG